jgi:hypothetical protein
MRQDEIEKERMMIGGDERRTTRKRWRGTEGGGECVVLIRLLRNTLQMKEGFLNEYVLIRICMYVFNVSYSSS